MSLKFNQVFVGLLALAFVSAFVLPSKYTNPVRSIQGLFYPVSRPARAIGYALNQRYTRQPKDTRAVEDVKSENEQLRLLVSSLTAQLEDLQRVNADRTLILNVQKLCTPAKVIGNGSAAQRESLSLRVGTLDGIRDGMPVLYRHGVVGRIERAGPGGSQVQLCTDRDFGIAAQFRHYTERSDKRYVYETHGQTQPFVKGAGRGKMVITNVQLKETTDAIEHPIRVGDTVVADDPDWESARGQWLGKVEKIEPSRLFAVITVAPIIDLDALDEVMVMNKTPADAAQVAAEKSGAANAN
jgi:cell shape-determining protein MreC